MTGETTRLFQITEPDLAELEHLLPELQHALFPELANPLLAPRLRVQLRRCKEILSNVRWDYGPPTQVETYPAEGPGPSENDP